MICNCPFRNVSEGQTVRVERGHFRCVACNAKWTVDGATGVYKGDYFDQSARLYHRVIVDRCPCPGCGVIIYDWRIECDSYQPNLSGIAATSTFTLDDALERMKPAIPGLVWDDD